MKMAVSDIKYYRSIKDRFYHRLAPSGIAIPEFQLASVLMLPIFVEVDIE